MTTWGGARTKREREAEAEGIRLALRSVPEPQRPLHAEQRTERLLKFCLRCQAWCSGPHPRAGA